MPGLRARLPGAGAGRLQGPGRQAVAGGQDDGPPLPLLHAGPGGSRARAGASAAASSAGAGRSTRTGASTRLSARACGRSTASTTRRPTGARAAVDADRDGHEPLPADQALLRAHAALVHDRAAHADLSGDDRRLPPPRQRACPTTCRAAASRARSSPTARSGRCRSARASSAAPRTTTAARPTRRCAASTCGRTLLDAKAYYGARRSPVQHDPPDPARARADRQRHVPHARRASRSRPGRCSSASPTTPTRSCTSPRWASGCCCSSRDDTVTACAPMPTDLREVTVPAKYDQHGAVRL